jgi:hypothetical protein
VEKKVLDEISSAKSFKPMVIQIYPLICSYWSGGEEEGAGQDSLAMQVL